MGKTEHNPYWLTWVWQMETDPHALDMVTRYMLRPAEQLYDVQSDPFEMNNLALDPQHARIRKQMALQLDRWMRDQGDPGAALDTKQNQQAAQPPAQPAAGKKGKRKQRPTE